MDNLSERNLSCRNKLQKEYYNKIKQNNKSLKFEIKVLHTSKIKLLQINIPLIYPDYLLIKSSRADVLYKIVVLESFTKFIIKKETLAQVFSC